MLFYEHGRSIKMYSAGDIKWAMQWKDEVEGHQYPLQIPFGLTRFRTLNCPMMD